MRSPFFRKHNPEPVVNSYKLQGFDWMKTGALVLGAPFRDEMFRLTLTDSLQQSAKMTVHLREKLGQRSVHLIREPSGPMQVIDFNKRLALEDPVDVLVLQRDDSNLWHVQEPASIKDDRTMQAFLLHVADYGLIKQEKRIRSLALVAGAIQTHAQVELVKKHIAIHNSKNKTPRTTRVQLN
jgi:hypothetical protein